MRSLSLGRCQRSERALIATLVEMVVNEVSTRKIRKGGSVWNHSALIAVGINSKGMSEILGFTLADSEKED